MCIVCGCPCVGERLAGYAGADGNRAGIQKCGPIVGLASDQANCLLVNGGIDRSPRQRVIGAGNAEPIDGETRVVRCILATHSGCWGRPK